MKRTLYFLLLMTTSCIKDVTYLAPNEPLKLVVSGFISPKQEKITVYVSYNQPVFGTSNANLSQTDLQRLLGTATVTLSDGTSTKTLAYVNTEMSTSRFINGIYQISSTDIPVVAGKTYTLQVSTTDGKSVIAHTTVPEPVMQPLVSVMGYKTKKGYDNRSIRYPVLKYQFNDNINQENYYECYSAIKKNDNSYSISEYGAYVLTDDIAVSGQLYEKIVDFSELSNYIVITANYVSYFIACSKEYYLFRKTYSGKFPYYYDSNGSNPFSEPANIYSNVQGGLGCFAAYNETTIIHPVN